MAAGLWEAAADGKRNVNAKPGHDGKSMWFVLFSCSASRFWLGEIFLLRDAILLRGGCDGKSRVPVPCLCGSLLGGGSSSAVYQVRNSWNQDKSEDALVRETSSLMVKSKHTFKFEEFSGLDIIRPRPAFFEKCTSSTTFHAEF